MSKIYWIDDNFGAMHDIMHNTFKKFWNLKSDNKGIACKILLLGNDYTGRNIKPQLDEEDEKEWQQDVEDYFYEVCIDIDEVNEEQETYKNNKSLVEQSVEIIFKENDEEEKTDLYNRIVKWVNTPVMDEEIMLLLEKLINLLCLEPDSIVGIDMFLWNNDKDRLYNNNNIFSLALYNKLEKDGFKCFIYSSYADDKELEEKCKEQYEREYGEALKSKIFLRSDFAKRADEDVIKAVKEMMK